MEEFHKIQDTYGTAVTASGHRDHNKTECLSLATSPHLDLFYQLHPHNLYPATRMFGWDRTCEKEDQVIFHDMNIGT